MKNKITTNNSRSIESIAEQWVNLVLAHIRAKKLSQMKNVAKVDDKKCYAKCK
ncbi:MAG: hypothetical protein UZ21_OP11001000292 [Microgenomates bacterium OLB22]|nr:MAG: hypothetical protein UZ21_OP11001000292 [Microgenomates bacterium OLB22]